MQNSHVWGLSVVGSGMCITKQAPCLSGYASSTGSGKGHPTRNST